MTEGQSIPGKIIKLVSTALEHALIADSSLIQRVSEEIEASNRVFLLGAGRSGLVAKAFATRLMHLNIKVYIGGECTTPRIKQGDLAIVVSASGSTPSIAAVVNRIWQAGVNLLLVTQTPDSLIGRHCHNQVVIPCTCSMSDCRLLPLGSLFEISSLLLLESVIASLQQSNGISEKDMLQQHTILE